MAYKIIASKLFQKRVIALNDYLQKEWGLAVASDFHETLIKTILIIADQPGIGAISRNRNNVRKILITKHNRLYYLVKDDKIIFLLTLFDTRQNPNEINMIE